MAGPRQAKLNSTAHISGQQSQFVADGYLSLNHAPYQLSTNIGDASQNDVKLRNAIADAYKGNLGLAIEADFNNRDFWISKPIFQEQLSTDPDGARAGGGGKSQRTDSHSIRGIPNNGFLPTFRVPDGANIQDFRVLNKNQFPGLADIGHIFCAWIAIWKGDPTGEIDSGPTRQYCNVARNIRLNLGNNPELCGVWWAGAQAMLLADFEIFGEDFFVGISELSGSGGGQVNVTIDGGKWGIAQTIYRPSPAVRGFHLKNQSLGGVLITDSGGRGGVNYAGCLWESNAQGYHAIHQPREVTENSGNTKNNNQNGAFGGGNSYVHGCQVKMTGGAANGTVFDCYDTMVAVVDSQIKCGNNGQIVHTGKRDTPSILNSVTPDYNVVTGWVNALKRIGTSIQLDGVNQPLGNNDEWLDRPLTSTTREKSIAELRTQWAWKDSEILHPYSSENIRWNGRKDTRSGPDCVFNTQSLNQLILDTTNPSHADFGKTIFIPRGWYYFHGTIEVKAGAKIAGAGQSLVWLQPADSGWAPTSETPLMRTENNDQKLTILQGLGLNVLEAKPSTGEASEYHKHFCLLHVRGLVLINEVQPTIHEYYNAGSPPVYRRAPLVRFSDRCCGRVYYLPLDQLSPRNVGASIDGFAYVRINDKTTRKWLKITDMNLEKGETPMCVIERSDRIWISPLKCETAAGSTVGVGNQPEPLMHIIDSRGIIIGMISGNIATKTTGQINGTNQEIALIEDELIKVVRSPGVHIFTGIRQGGSASEQKYWIKSYN